MRTPALALGWELWARNRWGLSAILAFLLTAVALAWTLPEGPEVRKVANVTMILFFFIYLYLLSVFVYAENTLGTKSAGFPPRLFALPVRTSLLVAWPMLYGMAAVALLWIVETALILVPSGIERQVEWWPALLFAALMAAFQAVCWTVARAPLVRLVTAIIVLPSVALSVAIFCAHNRIDLTIEDVALILCMVIAASYLVAVAGVARDRRGDRLGWAWVWQLLSRALPRLPGAERPFASAAAAQRWVEVRRHAWILPAFVGFFLAMLFWGTALPLSVVDVARVLAALVGLPTLLAFFVGFGMGKTSFWARDLQLSSFTATRPVSSAALARAKLQTAGVAALTTWLLVMLLTPLWAVVTGNAEVVGQLFDAMFHDQPVWKLAPLLTLAAVGMLGLYWLQLVAGLCLSLTGRAAVVNGVTLFYLAVGGSLLGLVPWTLSHPDFLDTLLVVLWALGVTLAALKVGLAAWTWSRQQTPAALLVLWIAVICCLLVPLYGLMPEGPVSPLLIGLYVALGLPLARLIGLPQAVAWNRHR